MATVIVKPGICGFEARIVAQSNEDFEVTLSITSECAHIRQLAEQLTCLSPFKEVRAPMPATSVYQAAGACKLHAACPVPCGVLKAMEVAAGLALPAEVSIQISRDA
ncbi:MAG: hypothetical protein GX557_08040 [Chloroflexi bacterium]|nr:hypothetical protein [Chloroflexota bacterium]